MSCQDKVPRPTVTYAQAFVAMHDAMKERFSRQSWLMLEDLAYDCGGMHQCNPAELDAWKGEPESKPCAIDFPDGSRAYIGDAWTLTPHVVKGGER